MSRDNATKLGITIKRYRCYWEGSGSKVLSIVTYRQENGISYRRKTTMNLKDIFNWITGFSTPFFGVTWQPRETERDSALKIILYLQTKRVLSSPTELEIPKYCMQSVLDIKQFLTSMLLEVHAKDNLVLYLKEMILACNSCLTYTTLISPSSIWGEDFSDEELDFFLKLSLFRKSIAVDVEQLAKVYKLDVDTSFVRPIFALDVVK